MIRPAAIEKFGNEIKMSAHASQKVVVLGLFLGKIYLQGDEEDVAIVLIIFDFIVLVWNSC